MSRPHSSCLATTCSTASRTACLNSALRAPGCLSSASRSSTTFGVRGRLPVWVVRMRFTSEPAHHLDDVLDIRWRREAVADQFSPFVKIGCLAKILGVIFKSFPLHEQPVALRHFMRLLQRHEFTAFSALENRRGLFYASLELGLHAGFHVDLRNLKYHGRKPSVVWRRHYG